MRFKARQFLFSSRQLLKRAILLSVLCSLALFAGCAERAITPNAVFDFKSPEQQRDFERRANVGDFEAARRLVDYYFFWKNDPKKALYWAKVGGSHGDKVCAYNARKIKEIEQNR